MSLIERPGEPVAALAPPPAGASGLTSDEVAARLARDGPNVLVPEAGRSRWRRWVGPLADPMVVLLLVAVPAYLLIGETADAVVALVATVPIAGVGWLLEARAERTLEQLRRLTAPTATVWRDGEHRRVPTADLVVGDLLWLHEGDVVPADGEVLELTQLLVDESSLSGESLPVAKAREGDHDATSLWAGTTVLSGRGIVRVTATGPATRYGRIGALVAEGRAPRTPLQRALLRLVRILAVVAAVFCVAVMAAELLRGSGWGEAVIAGVSLAIAAIPEEFSMVYGLYLGLGAWRLARVRALVRNLPGVETLGSTTVICTDKTGTLTHGRLDLTELVPVGATSDEVLLTAAVLACEPDPFDPLDLAVVARAREAGVAVDELHGAALVADWPFDPAERYLTHVWRLPDGRHRVATKGAVEGVLAHCEADAASRAAVLAEHEALADRGMRLLAVAVGELVDGPTGDRARDEGPLHLAGLIAFADPVRPGVPEALAECRQAGVRVIMITGDHPATAHAVAEGLQLPHAGPDGDDLIVTGDRLDAADPAELDALVATGNVFARIRPEQKHALVQVLRRQGEVVAMTGDGINDAPALRAADIGVAMGERGTEVAREAATLVLLDDNFATIVGAVRNGRRIYDNLAHAFAYLVAFHPPLMIAALVVPLLGEPLLLLPIHLVILELLLHPVVSLVFEADPAAPDVMERPPAPSGRSLGVAALWRPYAVGVVLAAGLVAVYLAALGADWPVEQARALGLATLLVSQPFLLLTTRCPEQPLWRAPLRPTRILVIALAAIVATTLGLVYLPPLQRLAHLEPFPPTAWFAALAVAAVTTLWAEPLKRVPSTSTHR